MDRLTRIAAALSELMNACIGGHNNETLSGRAWRTNHWTVKYINRVFFWQENHCLTSHLDDVKWAHEFLDFISKDAREG